MKTRGDESMEAAGSVVADGFISVPEAAQFLHLSRAKIYQMMDSRQLPFARFGRARRVPKRALVDFAEASLVG